jgi:hypothetical protein
MCCKWEIAVGPAASSKMFGTKDQGGGIGTGIHKWGCCTNMYNDIREISLRERIIMTGFQIRMS